MIFITKLVIEMAIVIKMLVKMGIDDHISVVLSLQGNLKSSSSNQLLRIYLIIYYNVMYTIHLFLLLISPSDNHKFIL